MSCFSSFGLDDLSAAVTSIFFYLIYGEDEIFVFSELNYCHTVPHIVASNMRTLFLLLLQQLWLVFAFAELIPRVLLFNDPKYYIIYASNLLCSRGNFRYSAVSIR